MVKKAFSNEFDAPFGAGDKYEKKYFRYLGIIQKKNANILDMFKTKDIAHIEGIYCFHFPLGKL